MLAFGRVTSLCICFALLASSCTGGDDEGTSSPRTEIASAPAEDDGAVDRLAAELRKPFSEATIDAGVEAFARAGIPVFDDSTRTLLQRVSGDASAFRYTRFQVRNLVLETSAHAGYSGKDLDALRLTSGRLPSVSEMLDRYAEKVDTFGARLTRALIKTESGGDRASLRYPTMAIALFLADVYPREPSAATAAVEAPTVYGGLRGAAVAFGVNTLAAQDEEFPDELDPLVDEGWGDEEEDTDRGICGAVQDFFENVGEMSSGLIGPVVGGILETVVGIALEGTGVMAQLRRATAALTTLVQAASVLRTWEIEMEVAPEDAHYSVGDDTVSGEFAAHITDGGGFDPPAWLDACAELVGLDLPESQDAPGSEIKWEKVGIPPHAKVVHEDTTVPESSKAVLQFEMTSESEDQHEEGEIQEGEIVVTATVKRRDVRVALDRAVEAVLGELSGPTQQLLSTFEGEVRESLAELLDPSAEAEVAVDYHSAQSASISWGRGGANFSAYSCEGPRGPWVGTLQHTAGGSAPFRFEFPEGSDTTELNITLGTIAGPLNFSGTATLQGGSIEISGTTTVSGSGGSGTAVAPIEYGEVEECE